MSTINPESSPCTLWDNCHGDLRYYLANTPVSLIANAISTVTLICNVAHDSRPRCNCLRAHDSCPRCNCLRAHDSRPQCNCLRAHDSRPRCNCLRAHDSRPQCNCLRAHDSRPRCNCLRAKRGQLWRLPNENRCRNVHHSLPCVFILQLVWISHEKLDTELQVS